MSEKQFKVLSGGFDEEGNPLYLIKDTKDTTDMIGDYEICKKVIKQQATITKLKELNDDKGKKIISLIRTNKTLKEDNEQLKKQLSACKEGQQNLMKGHRNDEEALDKIWNIIKELYGSD